MTMGAAAAETRPAAVARAPRLIGAASPAQGHDRAVTVATASNRGSAWLVSLRSLSPTVASNDPLTCSLPAMPRGAGPAWLYGAVAGAKRQSLAPSQHTWEQKGS